jgi:hypothetical protein
MIVAAEKVFEKPWTEANGELGQANQCTTVAEKALDAGGLQNGEMTPYIKIGNYEIDTRNYLPDAKQKGIETSFVHEVSLLDDLRCKQVIVSQILLSEYNLKLLLIS